MIGLTIVVLVASFWLLMLMNDESTLKNANPQTFANAFSVFAQAPTEQITPAPTIQIPQLP